LTNAQLQSRHQESFPQETHEPIDNFPKSSHVNAKNVSKDHVPSHIRPPRNSQGHDTPTATRALITQRFNKKKRTA